MTHRAALFLGLFLVVVAATTALAESPLTGPLTSPTPNGALAPASTGSPSPAGCTVKANNPHLSTAVPGAASGDGTTKCLYPVPTIQFQPFFQRYINGVYQNVGDRDGYLYTRQLSKSVGGSSKENPCRANQLYLLQAYGYSFEGGKWYGGYDRSPGMRVC